MFKSGWRRSRSKAEEARSLGLGIVLTESRTEAKADAQSEESYVGEINEAHEEYVQDAETLLGLPLLFE